MPKPMRWPAAWPHAMLSREGTGPAWQLAIEEARLGYARVRMRAVPTWPTGTGSFTAG